MRDAALKRVQASHMPAFGPHAPSRRWRLPAPRLSDKLAAEPVQHGGMPIRLLAASGRINPS